MGLVWYLDARNEGGFATFKYWAIVLVILVILVILASRLIVVLVYSATVAPLGRRREESD